MNSVTNPYPKIIETPRPVVAKAMNWTESHEVDWHFHNRAQLLYASSGVMDVSTPSETFVLPPQRALWLPKFVAHKVHAKTTLSFRTVYIDQEAAPWLPEQKSIILVTPLLKELILCAIELPTQYLISGRENSIMTLLIEEIAVSAAEKMCLSLPEPIDRRVKKIVNAIKKTPSQKHSVEDWAKRINLSSRTIDRVFRKETGLSFDQWKRQAVLLEALRQLADGDSVTKIAIDLGYESPSAFVAMFRRTLGTTPGKLFE